MSDDDDKSRRRTPPEGEDDWLSIWAATHKAHLAWVVVGPIHAAVTNWRAWIVIAGIVGWINGRELVALISSIVGGG